MGKNLICPNTEICPVYKLEHLKTYDCIKNKEGKYSCEAVEKFNSFADRDKIEVVSKFPSECALVEILNRVKTL